MSQTRNYITIDSVINDYIDESEQSVHKYAKLYNIAVRGMEKLGLDFFYKIFLRVIKDYPNKSPDLFFNLFSNRMTWKVWRDFLRDWIPWRVLLHRETT